MAKSASGIGRLGRGVMLVALAVAAVHFGAPLVKDAVFVGRLLAEGPPQQLSVPVQGVAARGLRDTWGAPRGADRRHEGIDIFARRGTPVLAATRGIVVRTGSNDLGGNIVGVLGPGGDFHYYAHLDRPTDLKARQRVAPGTVLGYVGTTGNAAGTPPHLHYGIYRRGTGAINPFPLLAATPSSPAAMANKARSAAEGAGRD